MDIPGTGLEGKRTNGKKEVCNIPGVTIEFSGTADGLAVRLTVGGGILCEFLLACSNRERERETSLVGDAGGTQCLTC